MSPARKKLLQRVFCRIACDLHYKADFMEVARVASIVTPQTLPMDFWFAAETFDNMERIANGTHPCLMTPEYAPYPLPQPHQKESDK